MSGNTFGSKMYSDGMRYSPMLPLPPAVVGCEHCKRAYWLKDAKNIGIRPYLDEGKSEWSAVNELSEPSESGYYRAIKHKLAADKNQERFLRIQAWWRRNDRFRNNRDMMSDGKAASKSEADPTSCTPECRENLEALAKLLDKNDPSEALMIAEIKRELGEFDHAKKLLDAVQIDDLQVVVSQIRSRCERRDAAVCELRFKK
jgi:hypothetical protein